jgi:hypothetical protein
MTADERLTAAWEALHDAHDADMNDETDCTPVPPEVYAEVRAAEQAWMVGKTIASVETRTSEFGARFLIMTFTDGTRASFEGNTISDLCFECLNDITDEVILYVREDVDCREEIHGLTKVTDS